MGAGLRTSRKSDPPSGLRTRVVVDVMTKERLTRSMRLCMSLAAWSLVCDPTSTLNCSQAGKLSPRVSKRRGGEQSVEDSSS